MAEEAVPGIHFWAQNWRKGGLQERRNELLKQSQSLHILHLLYHYTKSSEKIKSILHHFFAPSIFWRKGGMSMPHLWSLGTSPSHAYACQLLQRSDFLIEKEWTAETQGVLLDIPSFRDSARDWTSLFSQLKPRTRVFGGNLGNRVPLHLVQFDLLQDPLCKFI